MILSAKISSSPGGASIVTITEDKDHATTEACQYLAKILDLNYKEVQTKDDPINVIKNLQASRVPQMLRLKQEPTDSYELLRNWCEILGAMHQPSLILVAGMPSNLVTNIAAVYQILLETSHVPLIGLVQIGGQWDISQRRYDKLAWCGWLQEMQCPPIRREISDLENCYVIRKRWAQIINDNFLENSKH